MTPEQRDRLERLYQISPQLALAALDEYFQARELPAWQRPGKPGARKVDRKRKAKDRKHRRDVRKRKRARR
jgi:hypothetical protein